MQHTASLLRDLGVSTSRTLLSQDPSEGLPFSLKDPLLARHLLARVEGSARSPDVARAATLPSFHMLSPTVDQTLPASTPRYSVSGFRSDPSLVPVGFIPSADDLACAIGVNREASTVPHADRRGFFGWILSLIR